MKQEIRILAVDDSSIYLQLLTGYLSEKKYRLTVARNGREALDILERDNSFHVLLLDWMMPEMDGLELLCIIKQRPELKRIPVIMQTAKSDTDDYVRGINAGAYYYLAKPYKKDMLLSILNAAVLDYFRYLELLEKIKAEDSISILMSHGEFQFRNLKEAEHLAHWLSLACPVAENAIMGISELFINAIEHGNLGIGYQEKSMLLKEGTWMKEIQQRLSLPEYREKHVSVSFMKTPTTITIGIKDMGKGFDFEKYFTVDEKRLGDSHGRGILMAKMLYLDEVNYLGCGNEVKAVINFP